MTVERMFVAVSLPSNVADLIAELPTRALRGVSYTKRSQWHITVRFLGNADRAEAIAALGSIEAPAAKVELGPRVALLGDRVVMVAASGLDAVAVAVDDAFDGVGEPSERTFVGHVTLARLKGVPLRDPSRVSVLGASISTTFTADSISLFASELGAQGAQHALVAQQRLH